MDVWTVIFAHSVLLIAIYIYIKVLGKFVNRFIKRSMLRRGGIASIPTLETNASYAKEIEPEIDLHILRPKDKFLDIDHHEIVNFATGARFYGNFIVVLTILFFAVVYTLNAHGIGNPDKKSIGDSLYLDFYLYILFSYTLYRFIFYFPVNGIAYFGLIKKMWNVPSYKLMILRVFGSKKHTKFLFSTFSSVWSAFGPSITIMDPVLIDRQFRLLNLIKPRSLLSRSIYLPMIFSLPILLLVFAFIKLLGTVVISISLIGILITSQFIYISWLLTRKFKASSRDIVKTVQKSIPKRRNSKMEFPPSELYCYDDVWKSAVIETGKNVDIVLMDIRDYSSDRAGSSWELDYLAKNFNLDKVLFLADTEEKAQSLKNMLAISLKEISPSSPNDRDKIQIHTFVSTEQSIFGNGTDIARHLYSMASTDVRIVNEVK